MIYVSQLPSEEQAEILSDIRKQLVSEGYTSEEISEALEMAQNSKLSDLQ